jgi:UrcA family protein
MPRAAVSLLAADAPIASFPNSSRRTQPSHRILLLSQCHYSPRANVAPHFGGTVKTSSRLAVLAAAFAIVATSSASADSADVPSLTVKATGLDLTTDQGMREMYARIERAAEKLCSNISARELPRQRQLFKQCVNDATSKALASLDESAFRRYAMNRFESRKTA